MTRQRNCGTRRNTSVDTRDRRRGLTWEAPVELEDPKRDTVGLNDVECGEECPGSDENNGNIEMDTVGHRGEHVSVEDD